MNRARRLALAAVPALLAAVAILWLLPRPRAITFADVAPILARRCLSCHGDQGLVAQPSLRGYADVARVRARIRSAVWTRRMPPWLADNSGACGQWQDALWLPSDEVQTIVAWIDGGAEGADPKAAASQAEPAPRLAHVDATLDTKAPFKPGLVDRAYRCFLVDPRLASDHLLTAMLVSSTDPRMVAQLNIFSLDSEAAEVAAARLHRTADDVGYPCYSSPLVSPNRLVASWTWDSPLLRFPRGTGVRLIRDRKLVVQIHYNVITSGLSASTQTRVDLEFDDLAQEASFIDLAPPSFTLPPGKRLAVTEGEMTLSFAPTVWGVAPRMHTRARSMEVDRVESAGNRCLAAFEHWNVYQQRVFFYAEPKRLARGDRLHVSCTYDTEGRQQPVLKGDDIEDEDCTASLYVTAHPGEAIPVHGDARAAGGRAPS